MQKWVIRRVRNGGPIEYWTGYGSYPRWTSDIRNAYLILDKSGWGLLSGESWVELTDIESMVPAMDPDEEESVFQ